MSRADSPLRGRVIFAFGARRSGTLWLQRILTAHPAVSAVPSETYLFELGIRPLLERFHHGARSSTTVAQMYADREELLDATRDFCDRMLLPFLPSGARFVSERSPGHAKALDVIGAVYPDARQIHIIRDGRDVARSLAARDWGPGGLAEAARDWRENVEEARANAGAHYLEVRYEDLLADLETGIRRLYDWLDLEAGDDLVADVVREAHRPVNQDPQDPRLARGKWRDHFSPEDAEAVQSAAGDLLAELGYTDEGAPPASAPPPPPASAPSSRVRALGRRLRGIARARASAADPDDAPQPRWEVGGHLADALKIADELLARLHSGDRDGVAAVLHSDVILRVVTPDGDRQLSGREASAAELTGDDAWRLPQLRGDSHAGTPSFSLTMAYGRDGAVEWRIVYLRFQEGLIRTITVYRLAA